MHLMRHSEYELAMVWDFVHFYGVSTHLFYGLWGVEAKIESLQEAVKEKNRHIFRGSLNSQV